MVTPLTRSRFGRGEGGLDFSADPSDEVDASSSTPEVTTPKDNDRRPSAVPPSPYQQSLVKIQEIQLDIERTLETTTIYREQAVPSTNIRPQSKEERITAADTEIPAIEPIIPLSESVAHDKRPASTEIVPKVIPQKSISVFPAPQVSSGNKIDSGGNDKVVNRSGITSESPTPTIKISIGRIEIKAQQQPKPVVAKKPKTPRQPNLTLEDYLKKRK